MALFDDKPRSATSTTAIDFNHPLYLHPSDTQAITQILTGSENYAIWSRAMSNALLAKNKVGIVDDTYAWEEQDPSLQPQWDHCNIVVLAWLINSIDMEISNGIAFSQKAHLIWLDLKERFDKTDSAHIFVLHRSINTLVQGTMTVSQFFMKLRDFWDEYGTLVPSPSCKCLASQEYIRVFQQ